LRVNEQIRIPKVLVIDENGQKLGVMDTRDAIRLARSKGLDLIEVAPQARPPVCRIMDYGKFKYQQRKREKEARKHHKELKEIRLTPQIGEHDLMHRIRNAEEFLREGHRVRVFMQVRDDGRRTWT
jgi:translation initiation factor IF-3